MCTCIFSCYYLIMFYEAFKLIDINSPNAVLFMTLLAGMFDCFGGICVVADKKKDISLSWTLIFVRYFWSIFLFISPSIAVRTWKLCVKLSLRCNSSKRRISYTLIVFWEGCMYQRRLGFHQTNCRWKLFDILTIQPLSRKDILCGWKQ